MFLQEGGVDGVVSVTVYSDTPENLDGEHRTLPPDVWAGIGHRPDRKSASIVEPIGVVAVTLSPFTGRKTQPMEQRMSTLDAGGVAWLLAACGNPRHVAVVVSPKRYNTVLAMLRDNQGKLDEGVCGQLAQEAIIEIANYVRRVRAKAVNGY